MFSLAELQQAHRLVGQRVDPTPSHIWPLLNQALGAEVVVKHENHAPTGAFKVRGGITFIDWLRRTHPECRGIVTATRGNHGQSQARAAVAAGLRAQIWVPEGNSADKNAAMQAYGAELRIHGADFDEAKDAALRAAEAEGLYFVPSFHRELIRGVATYGLELFTAHPDLDAVYVPIGLGSGICGTIAARDAVGSPAKVIGVVSDQANAAKRSVEAGHVVSSNAARTFADGMAVRTPSEEALAIYSKDADHIGEVSEAEIAEAIRLIFATTHNVAEGSGAAALALALKERDQWQGRKIAVVLSGGNIDQDSYATVLGGGIPKP